MTAHDPTPSARPSGFPAPTAALATTDLIDADNPMSVAAPFLLGYLAFIRHDRNAAWTFFTTSRPKPSE